MSANATNSSKRKMDCARVARDEILEAYLVGRLSEEDRDAFEVHYFECGRCFDELKTLQAIREELPRVSVESETTTTHRLPRWLPAAGLAAALVLAVSVPWMRPTLPSGPSEATRPSSSQQLPATPTPQHPQPSIAPQPALEQLARVEPPVYEARRLRNAPDEATARFQAGMKRYRGADYRGAVAELRLAAELDPDAAHISFFLGISHLMLGQDQAAIDRLRATIALGDSPYLEEAHFYLAKAFLRRADLSAAETQLKELVQLRGSRSAEAERLITQIERLKQRSD
jgi:tetratricopeptide (TPR) repeat protein